MTILANYDDTRSCESNFKIDRRSILHRIFIVGKFPKNLEVLTCKYGRPLCHKIYLKITFNLSTDGDVR